MQNEFKLRIMDNSAHMKKTLRKFFIVLMIVLALVYRENTGSVLEALTDPDCENQIGAWYRGADIPFNHVEGASAVVGGKLYLFSGFEYYTSFLHVSDRISVYDPAANLWETILTPRNSTPFAASHIQATVQDDRYV